MKFIEHWYILIHFHSSFPQDQYTKNQWYISESSNKKISEIFKKLSI